MYIKHLEQCPTSAKFHYGEVVTITTTSSSSVIVFSVALMGSGNGKYWKELKIRKEAPRPEGGTSGHTGPLEGNEHPQLHPHCRPLKGSVPLWVSLVIFPSIP